VAKKWKSIPENRIVASNRRAVTCSFWSAAIHRRFFWKGKKHARPERAAA
jgi:hypothetical protein